MTDMGFDISHLDPGGPEWEIMNELAAWVQRCANNILDVVEEGDEAQGIAVTKLIQASAEDVESAGLAVPALIAAITVAARARKAWLEAEAKNAE
jgi:hypothetical protein